MDKKNTIIGVLLFAAAIGLMYYQAVEQAKNAPRPQPGQPQTEQTAADPVTPDVTPTAVPAPADIASTANDIVEAVATQADAELLPEQTYILGNELMTATFSTHGGSIKEIALLDFAKTKGSEERYIINEIRHANMLDIRSGQFDFTKISFELSEQTANSITFVANLNDQFEIYRRYEISQELQGEKPYLIKHSIDLRNLTNQALSFSNYRLNLGTFDPSGVSGPQAAQYLTFGYDNGNEDQDFYNVGKFSDSNFILWSSKAVDKIEGKDNIHWASVKNQFFITILTPEENGSGYLALPHRHKAIDSAEEVIGMTGYADFDSVNVPPSSTKTLNFDFYAGPKEHKRISKLGSNQEDAMDFGWWIISFISKFLLLILNGLYSIAPNWGVAIILLTLVVRFVLLPINLVSSKSMKRMGKLAEPMKQLKEAFPDNQQKQQMMMMELYKLNKVNPVAGCLPLLMQMPIFFGLFYMLRSAAELRFQEFLWIGDLSNQEGIFTMPFSIPFLGDQFNILPVLMTLTMYWQMKMTPTPSVDNMQAKMIKFMPFIFFPITYTFASGLVLYWTVSNCFTILQTWLINRRQDDFELQLPPALKKAIEGGDKKRRKKKK